MQIENLDTVRETISDILVDRGYSPEFGDTESLFDSGKLDSIAAVNLLMTLECQFGIDLSDPDFEIAQIDTFAAIGELVKDNVMA